MTAFKTKLTQQYFNIDYIVRYDNEQFLLKTRSNFPYLSYEDFTVMVILSNTVYRYTNIWHTT